MPEARPRLVTAPFVFLTAATFLFFCSVGLMLPTLPRFVRSGLGGSDRAVGVMVAAYSAAAILCRPFIAWFARVAGYRAMVLWGAWSGAVFQGLLALAHRVALLVVLRVGAGVAEAFLFVGVAIVVNEIAPVARRAEAASLNSVGVFLGLGLGPVIGDRLARAGHYRQAFLVTAVLCLLAWVMAWFVRIDPDDDRPAPARRVPLLNRGAFGTGTVLASVIVGYVGWTSFLPLRADEIGHIDAGRLFLIYSAIAMSFRLFGATVPERLGLARCAAAAVVAISVALGLMAVLDGRAALYAGTVIIGVGMALLYPSLLAITVNAVTDPAQRAAVVSTFTMFFEVGGALSGFLLGPVAAATSYRGAFGVGALVGAVGLGVLWRYVVVPRRAGLVPAG